MASRQLEPETWAHIISFLTHQPPPVKTECKWNELHQHDLTVVARVSPVLHAAASKLLYSQPIVNNLELFFHGLDDKSSTPTRISQPKSALLAGTTKLHLDYPTEKQFSFAKRPRNATMDSEAEKEKRRKDVALEEVKANHRALDIFLQRSKRSAVMLKLETISVGAWGDGAARWRELGGEPSNTNFNGLHQRFLNFILDCRVSHYCQHTPFGPLVLSPYTWIDDKRDQPPPIFVTDVTRPLSLFTVVWGAKSKVCIPLRIDSNSATRVQAEAQLKNDISRVLLKTIQLRLFRYRNEEHAFDHTIDLELYHPFAHQTMRDRILYLMSTKPRTAAMVWMVEESNMSLDDIVPTYLEQLRLVLAESFKGETEIFRLSELPFNDKFEYKIREDAGVCPACGNDDGAIVY